MKNKKSKDPIKYDCFAYKKNLDDPEKVGECIALNKLYCEYEDCSFYKTEEEFSSAAKRILKY